MDMKRMHSIVLVSSEGLEFLFGFHDDVWIFINPTSAVPVEAQALDSDKTPFDITCPEQHPGDCFEIVQVIRPDR